MSWTYFISDLNAEKIIRTFYQSNFENKSKRILNLKSYQQKNVVNYMVNENCIRIRLIAG